MTGLALIGLGVALCAVQIQFLKRDRQLTAALPDPRWARTQAHFGTILFVTGFAAGILMIITGIAFLQ